MYFINACFGEMRKQRRNYFSSWSTYISLLIWPILTVVSTFFSYKSFDIMYLNKMGISSISDLAIFLLTGFLCYNCFWVMVQSAFFMRYERENGTLETIFLSPAPRLSIVYGRSMGTLFQATWILVLYVFLVLIIGKKQIFNIIFVLPLVFIIVIISSIIWGGFINSIFIVSRDIDFWFSVCDEPMKLLSGVSLPVSIMPLALKTISAVFPLTYSLDLIRGVLVGEKFQSQVLVNYVMANLLIIVITTIIVNLSENNNRKTGNLQLY